MARRFDPKQLQKLDNPKRRALLPPEELLQRIGLQAGETFLDVGAGVGFFSLPAAAVVGANGLVLAVDIEEAMLAELKKRIPETVKHVRLILSTEAGLGDFKERADKAMLCLVLHEIEEPINFLKDIYKRLKTGATLTVVEWLKIEMEMGPPLEERMADGVIEELLSKAGFVSTSSCTLSGAFQMVTGVK